MKYLAIIEKGQNNYSAYFPDVPGCIATGKTMEELMNNFKAALDLHLKGMIEDGEELPAPISEAEYILV